MAKKSSNKSGGYKNKAQTAKNGKGKQGNKPRNTKGTSKRTTPQKQQPVNIYIVNEKDKGGKREDKRVEEREEQAAPSKSWLDYFREWRDARLAKKQEKEQKKRVKELKASTKKVKKGTPIVKVHKPAKNNAVTSNSKGVKLRASSGGSNHSGGSIFRVLKTPFIVVLCIALLATVVYFVDTKIGNNEGNAPWNIHKHYDKDGDHWCDKPGCGKCIPVDEDEDGRCDICNVCIHIDEDGDCWCDRSGCGERYHVDKDRDNKCDNCDAKNLEPTNAELFFKHLWEDGIKHTVNICWNALKDTYENVRDWTKEGFKDIGEWFVSITPEWMVRGRGDENCAHIDENNNGVCDKCLGRYLDKDVYDDCDHVDADNDGWCDNCPTHISGTEVKPGDGDSDNADGEDTPDNPNDPDTPDNPDALTGYVITFDANGGELTVDYTTKNTTESGMLMSTPGVNRSGYAFLGWYTASEGGEKIEILTYRFTQNTTIYAQWEVVDVCEHIDENSDNKCDLCGQEFATCEHIDEDDNNKCDICGTELDDGNGGDGDDGGDNGNEGEGGDEPTDKPDQPSVPSCEHRDTDDDGDCDICGDPYDDGAEETPCEHRDADDDGKCDTCGDPYDDGVEETPCEHRDANDDGKCDICGDPYDDGDECNHRDANDNGLCDYCREEFNDGDECNHRDRTDDGLCDYCGEAWDDGIEKEYCNHGDLNDDGKCDLCGEPYEDGNDCAHRDDNNDWSCDNCGITYFDGDENTDMVFMEDVDGEYAPGALLVGASGYSQPFVLFDFDNEKMMDKIQAGAYQDGPILFLIQDAETGGFSAYAVIESAEGSTFENHAEKFWEISNADEIGCNSTNQEVVTVSTDNGIYVLCALRSDGSLKAIDATMKEAIYAGEDLGCFGGCAFIFVPVSEVDS